MCVYYATVFWIQLQNAFVQRLTSSRLLSARGRGLSERTSGAASSGARSRQNDDSRNIPERCKCWVTKDDRKREKKKNNNTILNNDPNPNQGCTMDRFLNRYRDASHSNKAITNERSKRSLANHPDRIPDKRHCWFLQLNTTFMSYCLYIYI